MLFLHLFVLIEIQLVYNILISSVKLIQNFYTLYSIYAYYGILPIFSVLCNITLQLIYFIHSTLCLLITSLYFAPPSSISLLMFSISVSLFLFCQIHSFQILDSACKGQHIVFVFLCQTYFTKHNTLQAHPCCYRWQILFFL